MYTKTIEYKDYNGEMRKEDFHFNLNQAELYELELSTHGGYDQWIMRIANTQDVPEMIKLFKGLIMMAYGEKGLDGKSFIKINPQTGRRLAEEFEQTAAYPVLFTELVSNAEAAAEFINKIIPAEAAEAVEKAKADGRLDEATAKIVPVSK